MNKLHEITTESSRYWGMIRLYISLLLTAFVSTWITLGIGFTSNVLIMFTSQDFFWEEMAYSYPVSKLVWMAVLYVLAGGTFALAWYVYWRTLSSHSETRVIRCFPLQLLFAYVPLLLLFLQINPVYNPDQMIPLAAGEVKYFLCLGMSAVLLFPFYSIFTYRFVLHVNASPSRTIRLPLLLISFALIGIGLLPLLWRLAPYLYPELNNFPNLY